ncbi:MAG: hypothetical protein MJE77_16355, partial [Proteobacteria bacterium]|nr:hypothetical protein [Pseudomonadota bacterium]
KKKNPPQKGAKKVVIGPSPASGARRARSGAKRPKARAAGDSGGPPAVRGIALGLYPDGRKNVARFDRMIDEIADVGANYVALVVTWAQRDVNSIRIAAGPETIDDATLRHAIDRAHQRELDVLVFPIVTVRKLSPGQWRGTLRPRDTDAWWQSYERFIAHYAAIAGEKRAAAFLLGSELGSTEAWQYRWYHLISRIERMYSGQLIYSANWDHYTQVSFWRRLDIIGVTGYFELSRDKNATEADLKEAWLRVRSELVGFARARKKPLWITEVGYTSVDGAATRPWDYLMAGPVDVEEQRRLYAAFVGAWDNTPTLRGVFFWNWYGKGGADDRGYTPKGKPAEAILRRWFGPPRSEGTPR